MRIGIYSPYLDTAGGGEKYMMVIAEGLSLQGEVVDVLFDNHLASLKQDDIKDRIEKFHGLDLSRVNFVKSPLGGGSSFLKRLFFLKRYDWFFYNTDGSFFFSTAKNSVVHFQMPLTKTRLFNPWEVIKLSSWKKAIYNSHFTQQAVEAHWPIRGIVIYPPVSLNLFKPLKKKKQIVSVGRFSGYTKVKKHQFMINTFINLCRKQELSGWSLHLGGGMESGDKSYFESLKKNAKESRVYFYPNISLDDLRVLYGESAIYWHAMGYGETDLKRYEHFGITTVEAMASGCVPIVINLGGQGEIVNNSTSGFLWNTKEELEEITVRLAHDGHLRNKISQEAQKRAKMFDKKVFVEKINKLVHEWV